MVEPINKSTTKDGQDPGTAPTKPVTPDPVTIDLSKLGDEDFKKVFDDPRLWTHPRFKELNDRASQAKVYEQEKKAAEETRLKEEGKFKELNAKLERERDEALSKANQAIIDNRITIAAQKLGVVDADAVLKLLDRSSIKFDAGNVSGVDEAVAALVTAKPYLKGDGTVTIGTGTAPGDPGTTTVRRFKLSQLQDAAYYRENEAEILKSMKAGLVEDDLNR